MKQKTLSESFDSESRSSEDGSHQIVHKMPSTRFVEVNLNEFKSHPLWDILVETTHRNPLYSGLLNYVHSKILPKSPRITPRELSSRLSISLGEALVILDEIRRQK